MYMALTGRAQGHLQTLQAFGAPGMSGLYGVNEDAEALLAAQGLQADCQFVPYAGPFGGGTNVCDISGDAAGAQYGAELITRPGGIDILRVDLQRAGYSAARDEQDPLTFTPPGVPYTPSPTYPVPAPQHTYTGPQNPQPAPPAPVRAVNPVPVSGNPVPGGGNHTAGATVINSGAPPVTGQTDQTANTNTDAGNTFNVPGWAWAFGAGVLVLAFTHQGGGHREF